MPTENRSSNTDPRDVFIRLNPLGLGEADLRKDSTGFEDQRTHSDYLLFLAGYRETHAKPQPHPEPIAWMVGTAFWWTKEEAERDAAATGKPMIPFGPMIDTGEVERLSATCAANIRARDEAIAEGRRYMGQASALDSVLREARRCVAESADPEIGGPTQREAQVILGKIDAALSASAEPEAKS